MLGFEDQTLMFFRYAFRVAYLVLDGSDGIMEVDVEGDCFACEGLDEDLLY